MARLIFRAQHCDERSQLCVLRLENLTLRLALLQRPHIAGGAPQTVHFRLQGVNLFVLLFDHVFDLARAWLYDLRLQLLDQLFLQVESSPEIGCRLELELLALKLNVRVLQQPELLVLLVAAHLLVRVFSTKLLRALCLLGEAPFEVKTLVFEILDL